jgi:hypothetical protein
LFIAQCPFSYDRAGRLYQNDSLEKVSENGEKRVLIAVVKESFSLGAGSFLLVNNSVIH